MPRPVVTVHGETVQVTHDVAEAAVPPPPPEASTVFAGHLPATVAYAGWLATAGIERGLIGPREVDRLWERHLLNCAALSMFIPQGSTVIDIGSGAGLPGLVLAIIRPDVHMLCVDSMLRRTTFLEEVVADLGLVNVQVRRARAEELAARGRGRPPVRADVVTARAVGSVAQLAGWAAPLLSADGALVTLKGAAVINEVRDAWSTFGQLGFHGGAEIYSVSADGAPMSDAAMPFRAELVATWAASSPGPSPADDADFTAAAAPGPDAPHPLATILRLSRSPG